MKDSAPLRCIGVENRDPKLTDLQKETLVRVLASGGWYRASSSGERVTLASLYRKGILERRARRGAEGDANAAYEYRYEVQKVALPEPKPVEYQHSCLEENALTYLQWFRERGGIAVWPSVNLSKLGISWTTPAQTTEGTPTPQPTQEADSKPSKVITDPALVKVLVPREVKRFRVAIRRSSNGIYLKCTEASTRRIHATIAKYPGSWYVFDYETQETVILVSDSELSLADWAVQQEKATP